MAHEEEWDLRRAQRHARAKFEFALRLLPHYYLGGGNQWLRATVTRDMPGLGKWPLRILCSLEQASRGGE